MRSAVRLPLALFFAASACGLVTSVHAQAPSPAATASAASAPGQATDCQRLWRDYRRSQECFARYRSHRGLRSDAFRACGPELPDPSAVCPIPRDESPAQRTR